VALSASARMVMCHRPNRRPESHDELDRSDGKTLAWVKARPVNPARNAGQAARIGSGGVA
jgi:hypothetical protein